MRRFSVCLSTLTRDGQGVRFLLGACACLFVGVQLMFEYRCVADLALVLMLLVGGCLTRGMTGRKRCEGGFTGGVDRLGRGRACPRLGVQVVLGLPPISSFLRRVNKRVSNATLLRAQYTRTPFQNGTDSSWWLRLSRLRKLLPFWCVCAIPVDAVITRYLGRGCSPAPPGRETHTIRSARRHPINPNPLN